MLRSLIALWIASITAAQAAPVEDLVAEAVATLSVEEHGGAVAGPDLRVRYAPSLTDAVAVARFWQDERTGRFAADLLVEDGSVRRVTGTAVRMRAVPVPLRDLAPGDLIAPGDVGTVRMPEPTLPGMAVTEEGALVGMEAHRRLPAGRPVVRSAVRAPLAVRRGGRIDISFRRGGLRLVAPGKALSDAVAGAEVRVVNIATNRTIRAIARADGTVEVAP